MKEQAAMPELPAPYYPQWSHSNEFAAYTAEQVRDYARAYAEALSKQAEPPRRARKVGGSYQAEGTIVADFRTLAGEQRFVFEFDSPKGMLHIFGPAQVEIDTAPVVKKLDAADYCLLQAAAKSGDIGAMTLAAQLAGVPPCDGCGYRKEFCKCEDAQAQKDALVTLNAKAVVRHWDEFGPEYGFDEYVELLRITLDGSVDIDAQAPGERDQSWLDELIDTFKAVRDRINARPNKTCCEIARMITFDQVIDEVRAAKEKANG